MRRRYDLAIAAAATIIGFGLHIWNHLFDATDFSAGFLLWSMAPYLLALGLLAPASRFVLAGAVVAILGSDLFTHISVHVWPTSSTAGLNYLFMPFWNSVIFLPGGAFIGWIIGEIFGEPRPLHRSRRFD